MGRGGRRWSQDTDGPTAAHRICRRLVSWFHLTCRAVGHSKPCQVPLAYSHLKLEPRYHVTSRGNGGRAIFFSDDDRSAFLRVLGVLGDVVSRFDWLCHAYCLLGNHYHLLVETREANLSKGMRQSNGVYTQFVNRTHQRVGHLFQGRFKGILVQKETYLLELARYIVLNPVRAGMVSAPAAWRCRAGKSSAHLAG
jgi:REP element-mobilizing transposase RayT